ncbi:site-specific integrase [Longispora urticae]
MTVADWLRSWLTRLPGRVHPSTLIGYTGHVNYHLIPHLGRIVLTDLTVRDVEDAYAAITTQTSRAGRPIGAATVLRVHATLRRALNIAVRDQLIVTNPARLVALPHPVRHRPVLWTAARVAAWRADGQHPPIAVWTPALLASFLTAVREDPLFALWWLAALRGLRRGELCALRWSDLDLEEGTATISRQLLELLGQVEYGPPKTADSERTIALDTATIAVLRHHQREQRRQRQEAGTVWPPGGLVFTNPRGQHVEPDWLSRRFRHLIAHTDMPPIRFHDLRHGAATLALAAGVDLKTIQTTLGHASIAFTADTYTTVLPATAHTAAEKTSRLVLVALGHRSDHGENASSGHTRPVRFDLVSSGRQSHSTSAA